MKYLLDQDHLLDYDSYRDQISESKKDKLTRWRMVSVKTKGRKILLESDSRQSAIFLTQV